MSSASISKVEEMMRDSGKAGADRQRGRRRGRADLCVNYINCRMWGNDERQPE